MLLKRFLNNIFLQSCILFLLCFIVKMTYVMNVDNHDTWPAGEMERGANSFARNGYIGNVFGENTGKTAHLSPVYPIFLGTLHKIADPGSERAILLQGVSSCIFTSLQASIMPIVGSLLNFHPVVGCLSGLIITFSPLHLWVETSGSWEQPLSCYLSIQTFILFLLLRKKNWDSIVQTILFSILFSITAMTTPSIIPAFILLLVIELYTKLSNFKKIFSRLCLVVLISFICILPWIIRNYSAFCGIIPLRSDLGLELSVGNYDQATGMTYDYGRGSSDPFFTMHPLSCDTQRKLLQELGEYRYMKSKQSEALTWINQNRMKFMQLSIKRFSLFWFPSIKMLPPETSHRNIRISLFRFLSIFTFLGLFLIFRKEKSVCLYLGVLLIGSSIVYYFTHVSLRYLYIVFWVKALCTSYLIYSGMMMLNLKSRNKNFKVKAGE